LCMVVRCLPGSNALAPSKCGDISRRSPSMLDTLRAMLDECPQKPCGYLREITPMNTGRSRSANASTKEEKSRWNGASPAPNSPTDIAMPGCAVWSKRSGSACWLPSRRSPCCSAERPKMHPLRLSTPPAGSAVRHCNNSHSHTILQSLLMVPSNKQTPPNRWGWSAVRGKLCWPTHSISVRTIFKAV